MATPSGHQEADSADAPYDILNRFFKSNRDRIIELEVLPQALAPAEGCILQDGTNLCVNLGVPKKVLIKAYLTARQIFFQNRNNFSIDSPAFQATNIILFFDPEHLTATNYRKKRILNLHKDNSQPVAVFYQEVLFVTNILTSPLHRQTKSPTLWHHRFWLFTFALERKLYGFPSDVGPNEYAERVFNPIFKSAEQHPKNYYAWQYARRMIERLRELVLEEPQRSKLWFSEFLVACAQKVNTWCCQHPSDTSGWSFLLFLIPQLSALERTFITKQVLGFTFNVHAQQESLWVFLRTVLALEASDQVRDGFVDRLKTYMKGRPSASTENDPDSLDVATSALEWIEKYKNTP